MTWVPGIITIIGIGSVTCVNGNIDKSVQQIWEGSTEDLYPQTCASNVDSPELASSLVQVKRNGDELVRTKDVDTKDDPPMTVKDGLTKLGTTPFFKLALGHMAFSLAQSVQSGNLNQYQVAFAAVDMLAAITSISFPILGLGLCVGIGQLKGYFLKNEKDPMLVALEDGLNQLKNWALTRELKNEIDDMKNDLKNFDQFQSERLYSLAQMGDKVSLESKTKSLQHLWEKVRTLSSDVRHRRDRFDGEFRLAWAGTMIDYLWSIELTEYSSLVNYHYALENFSKKPQKKKIIELLTPLLRDEEDSWDATWSTVLTPAKDAKIQMVEKSLKWDVVGDWSRYGPYTNQNPRQRRRYNNLAPNDEKLWCYMKWSDESSRTFESISIKDMTLYTVDAVQEAGCQTTLTTHRCNAKYCGKYGDFEEDFDLVYDSSDYKKCFNGCVERCVKDYVQNKNYNSGAGSGNWCHKNRVRNVVEKTVWKRMDETHQLHLQLMRNTLGGAPFIGLFNFRDKKNKFERVEDITHSANGARDCNAACTSRGRKFFVPIWLTKYTAACWCIKSGQTIAGEELGQSLWTKRAMVGEEFKKQMEDSNNFWGFPEDRWSFGQMGSTSPIFQFLYVTGASDMKGSMAYYVKCVHRKLAFTSNIFERVGRVATTVKGVEDCESQCRSKGFSIFSFECPGSNKVWCQCTSIAEAAKWGGSYGNKLQSDSFCQGHPFVKEQAKGKGCTSGKGNPCGEIKAPWPHQQYCTGKYTQSGYAFGGANLASVYMVRYYASA